jgi:GAF domain
VEQASTTRSTQATSVSSSRPLFTNSGLSLTEAAQRDLDAALQLLADRAQYITGASGAAIALRRDDNKDMLCRASTGTNAPELGALLSTESGLSGESVRTKHPLRCDDALSDARVNREICQQLSIGSVVVMPVVNDDQVLGVFELFSGKANAFGEKDLSAVQRLAEMVLAAVQLARAAGSLPHHAKAKGAAAAGNGAVRGEFIADLVVADPAEVQKGSAKTPIEDAVTEVLSPARNLVKNATGLTALPSEPSDLPKKPLFWSAPVAQETDPSIGSHIDQSNVPPVLRDLRKCVACGFPISAARMLCVECEEKKWRGQLRQSRSSVAAPAFAVSAKLGGSAAAAAPALAKAQAVAEANSASRQAASDSSRPVAIKEGSPSPTESLPSVELKAPAVTALPELSNSPLSEFTLSSGIEPSQSWLAANKYVLIVLIVIAAAASAIFFLR